MARLSLLFAIFISACGGGSSSAPVGLTPTGPTVYIGDSITASWPIPTGAINAGVGGQGSREMLARFQTDVMALRPSKVVIEAGTNDVGGPVGTEAIQTMAEIAVNSGAKVILVNVMSRNLALPIDVPSVRTAIQLFNNALLTLATTCGYTYVDAYSATLSSDGSLNSALTPDGLHLNSEGYKVLNSLL